MARTKSSKRDDLISKISRECIQCDACKAPGPKYECQKCHTAHACSSACLRAISAHQCVDLQTMRNAVIGMGISSEPPVPISQAKNTTCGICLEDEMTDPVVIPHCKHAFCRQCLGEWHAMEKFSVKVTCPTCRGVLLFDKSADNPIEKAKIYGARAHKATTASLAQRTKHCNKALEELDTLLSIEGSNLQALYTKAEILLLMSKPRDALEVLHTILDIDSSHRSRLQTANAYLEKAEAARNSGHAYEEEQLMNQFHEVTGARGEHVTNILQDLVVIFLLEAEARQQLGEWYEAKEIYRELLELPSGNRRWILWGVLLSVVLGIISLLFGKSHDGMVSTIAIYLLGTFWCGGIIYEVLVRYLIGSGGRSRKNAVASFPKQLRTPSIPQQRQCYMNMTKCFYYLQDYTRAIAAGELACHMNRHYQGVHEYIAKANIARGDVAEARRIMQRAALYETPWDTDNIEKQLVLLNEIS